MHGQLCSSAQSTVYLFLMQVQERFDVDITILPDHIDKELYRHDE